MLISLAKVFHSHEVSRDLLHATGIEHVEKSNQCSICDYHLVKDADFTAVAFTLPPLAFPALLPIVLQKGAPTSIGLCYGDRGPPVQA